MQFGKHLEPFRVWVATVGDVHKHMGERDRAREYHDHLWQFYDNLQHSSYDLSGSFCCFVTVM